MNQTLSVWLQAQVDRQPDAPALVDADGVLSFAELSERVAALCSGLAGLGIGRGDVVGVQLPNLREFVIALLAVTARGGIFQTLHMPYRSNELRGLLADSAAKAAIVTHAPKDSRTEDLLSIRDALPALEHVIVAGPAPEGCIALADLFATTPAPSDRVEVTTDAPYLLLYTSGTTAVPKGVPHTYRGFLNNALHASQELNVTPDSRVLSLAPMSHLYGLFTLHLSLASGAAMVLLPAFNPANLLDDLTAASASHVFAAPAHFAPFVANGALTSDHLADAQVLCLSGAAVPSSLAKSIDDLMPQGAVIQLWGMSELQAGTYGRPRDPAAKRFTTAGTAVPNTEIRVLGDDGKALSANQEGALEVRGPSVFAGYLNRPDETENAFDKDGWFSTGDLATIDADGFLTITGRTKEIINRGGVKFNPIEVEEVLVGLPAILQCAIVPVSDPELGERGCLCVELVQDAELTLEEATTVLSKAGMAKYKWPERLVIFDSLPTTPTRKVMRGKLSQMIETQKG
ncbi:acyl--CoA ligase [Gelidibacter sp. F2691]|nr:acyl--CoA ligase [Gelidibacter sp. F2691]